ncbi:MAG: MAE_28990/MAE_18760 family HEPN-like nuclease [Syntrophomonas sp.]
MKLKTMEQLQDLIDAEFAWRKKELSILKSKIYIAKGKTIDTEIRCGIALLYAHWEGFIKNSAQLYLEFVANQRVKYCELAPSFIALKLKRKLTECEQTNKSSIHTQIIDFLINDLENTSQIPFRNIINTESNLSSLVLKEIVHTIGLDYTQFETKNKLIDERLLKNRNEIAHGEFNIVDKDDFDEIFTEIYNLMNLFKNDILNAAVQKKYLQQVV